MKKKYNKIGLYLLISGIILIIIGIILGGFNEISYWLFK